MQASVPPGTRVLVFIHLLIALTLLVQIVLPIGSGRALAAPITQDDPPPNDQPVTEEPFAEILPPVLPDEPGAELIPSLPAAVSLALAQPVLVVDEKVPW